MKMRIKVNHSDPEIAQRIMDWLYENEHVQDNEVELKDEPLTNLLHQSLWWDLEIYLSDIFDEDIELNKNLKFIEF